MGFEFEVRVCDSCHESITDEEWVTVALCASALHWIFVSALSSARIRKRAPFLLIFSSRAPTATFHDSKHNVVYMHYEATTGNLLSSGTDKVIKVWT